MGNKLTWNWRSTVLKTIEMMMVRPLMTDFKMTVRVACAFSTRGPLLASKSGWSLTVKGSGESAFGQVSSPSPPAAGSQSKANFFHQPGLFTLEWWAARPHLWLQFQLVANNHLRKGLLWVHLIDEETNDEKAGVLSMDPGVSWLPSRNSLYLPVARVSSSSQVLKVLGERLLNKHIYASLVAQTVKNPPATQETQETEVWSLGQEDPLEEEMATQPRISAWRISWTEEPGGL